MAILSFSCRQIPRCLACMLSVVALTVLPGRAATSVIFDTDMDSDVDDVAAFCGLNALADRCEVGILAVMVPARNE